MYGVDVRTIKRINGALRRQIGKPDGADLHIRRKDNGRRRVQPLGVVKQRIAAISPYKTRTIRSAASAAQIFKSNLHQALEFLDVK